MKISLTIFLIACLVFLLVVAVFIIVVVIQSTMIDKLKAEKNLVYQDRSKLETELKEDQKITDKKEKLISEVKKIRAEIKDTTSIKDVTSDNTSDKINPTNYRRYIEVWNRLN